MKKRNKIFIFWFRIALLLVLVSSTPFVYGQTPPKAYRYIGNMFTQPNDSILNWYGSGDVNNDNIIDFQDVNRIDSLINGSFFDVTDPRLNDRADIDGNQEINSSDRNLLLNYTNGLLAYLPGHWNDLQTTSERLDWFSKMAAIDTTDEAIPYIDPVTGHMRDCKYYSTRAMINFNNFSSIERDTLYRLYSFSWDDHNRFNIPLYISEGRTYDASGNTLAAHAFNMIVFGDNALNPDDIRYFEPQHDLLYTHEELGDYDSVRVVVKGSPITSVYEIPATGTRVLYSTSYSGFILKNNEIVEIWDVDDAPGVYREYKMIYQRDYNIPEITISSPVNGTYYNSDISASGHVDDSTVFDMFYWINPVYDEYGRITDSDGKDYYNPYIKGYINGVPVDGEFFKEFSNKSLGILTEGVNTFELIAIDDFGNETSEEITFTIDKTPVLISIESPNNDEIYGRDEVVSLTGLLSDKNLDLTNSYYTLNGAQYPISDSILNIPLSSNDGANNLIIVAYDRAGNITSQIINYEINQAPVNEISEPLSGSIYNSNIVPFRGSVIDNNLFNVNYYLNDGTEIALSQEWDLELDLINGEYELVVHSEDVFYETDSDTINFTVAKPVSIEITELDQNFSIYPNPTQDRIRISLSTYSTQELSVQVYDLALSTILDYDYDLIPGTNYIELDLAGYNPGIYILKLTINQQKRTEKIVLTNNYNK